eukprot:gene11460-15352_t
MKRNSTGNKPSKSSCSSILLCSLAVVFVWLIILYYFQSNKHLKDIIRSEQETSEELLRITKKTIEDNKHVIENFIGNKLRKYDLSHPANSVEMNVKEELQRLDPDIIRSNQKQYKKGKDKNAIIESPEYLIKAPIDNNEDIHCIFSTDCSFFQDWQTLMVFHSAKSVGQQGTITRIASGCTDDKQKELTELYQKLFPEYHVHFTPNYKKDKKSGKSYDFYNKPYGMKHFLDNANPPVKDGVVLALLDPDFIFLRPLTVKIARQINNIYLPNLIPTDNNVPIKVQKGQPSAQLYALGAPWATKPNRNFNRTNVCGLDSPCMKVTIPFGEEHYSVGPPYLVEKSDMKRLTDAWVDFVPRVYEKYPELLAEMYAYSMAAAHAELPHFTMTHYMVSNTFVDEEGWKWIDALGDNVCDPPINGIYYENRPMPTFLHHCQFFRAGELGFQKRRLKKEIFSCDSPMMMEPPLDLGKVNYKNRDGQNMTLGPQQARRNAFMICVIHRSLNSLLIDYKSKMCSSTSIINYNKSINVVSNEYWPWRR